jgi:hypothetical protein
MRGRPSVIPALVLILIGLAFLLNNAGAFDDLDLDPEELWPALVVLAGLAFLLQFFVGGARDPGLVFVGTAATLLGLFFFLFTLNLELPFESENVRGPINWSDSAYLWPAYPLIGGIAFIMMALFNRERDVLWVGLVALAVGVVAAFFTLGRPEGLEELGQYWPVLLILVGGGLLLRPLLRGRRS